MLGNWNKFIIDSNLRLKLKLKNFWFYSQKCIKTSNGKNSATIFCSIWSCTSNKVQKMFHITLQSTLTTGSHNYWCKPLFLISMKVWSWDMFFKDISISTLLKSLIWLRSAKMEKIQRWLSWKHFYRNSVLISKTLVR